MNLTSTRGTDSVSLDDALVNGIAADGGLYLPEAFPSFNPTEFVNGSTIHDVAKRIFAPFFAESTLRDDLDRIIAETFRSPSRL